MAVSGSRAGAVRVASGLAYVCGHLDELRDLLGDDGSDPDKPLTRLVTALREQPQETEVAGLLDALHAAVQATGDEMGIYGLGGSRRGGLSGMEVLQIVFRCPLNRCAGRSAEQVTGPAPVCTVSPGRLPLRRERL